MACVSYLGPASIEKALGAVPGIRCSRSVIWVINTESKLHSWTISCIGLSIYNICWTVMNVANKIQYFLNDYIGPMRWGTTTSIIGEQLWVQNQWQSGEQIFWTQCCTLTSCWEWSQDWSVCDCEWSCPMASCIDHFWCSGNPATQKKARWLDTMSATLISHRDWEHSHL